MNWCGDYPEDYATVAIIFTTHDGNGAPVAPLTAFEAADVTIYKNGATAKATTNGITMTSPLNSKTGLHAVVIDTSNDTGDAGFWTTGGGSVYSVVLDPDTETVNSQTVRKVVGTFGICLSPALRPTAAGRTLDVTATGAAGLDWGNVENLTTSNALTGTTIATVTTVTGLTASNLDATISSRLASASYVAPDNTSVAAIKAKTDNLPSDPADQSLIIAATDAIATTVGALPTANQNADALLDRTDAIETGLTPRQALRLSAAADGGKLSGGATTTNTIRNAVADDKNRIIATVDASGNRTAIVYDLT